MSDAISLAAKRANRENDNRLLSPIDALEDALHDVRSGAVPASSVLILTLDNGEDGTDYITHWFASHLKSSDMISLMEFVKDDLLRAMKGD